MDHLVVHVDRFVQEDKQFIEKVRSFGLPYEPKWGKGTRGFKASNIWIGDEYFEFVRIKSKDGGGWIKSWTEDYHNGHRGLMGFCLEVDDIEAVYERLRRQNIQVTTPEPLQFKWFFNLLSKTMPWRNSYLPKLEGMPFQFFLQQLNDEKSRVQMQKYMVPNSRKANIHGITEVQVYGQLTKQDKTMIEALFQEQQCEIHNDTMTVKLKEQKLSFVPSDKHFVVVRLDCESKEVEQLKIANIVIQKGEVDNSHLKEYV